jgi:hypothetical protein
MDSVGLVQFDRPARCPCRRDQLALAVHEPRAGEPRDAVGVLAFDAELTGPRSWVHLL